MSDTLKISDDTQYTLNLNISGLNLQEVIISENYIELRKKEEPLNIEIVNDEYLRYNLGSSFMKSLDRLPGIATIDIGSGQSKPLIRGLGFNRVAIIENGIKHEAQQWGSDHGLEIDQYAVNHVEVIKVPVSLIYGSEAIGGVIDIQNRNIPFENTIGGSIDMSGKSNNSLFGTSISLFGRKNQFYADFRLTLIDYGDYKVPTDSIDIYSYRAALYKNFLRNTAGEEKTFMVHWDLFSIIFRAEFLSATSTRKEVFFANTHGLEPRNVDTLLHDQSARDILLPFQDVNHFKIINSSKFIKGKFIIKSNLGFQRNFRVELSEYVNRGFMPAHFPDSLTFSSDLERQFEKYVYSGNLKLRYENSEKRQLIGGANFEFQDNKIDGRGLIIPAYKQLTTGAFLLGKFKIKKRKFYSNRDPI